MKCCFVAPRLLSSYHWEYIKNRYGPETYSSFQKRALILFSQVIVMLERSESLVTLYTSPASFVRYNVIGLVIFPGVLIVTETIVGIIVIIVLVPVVIIVGFDIVIVGIEGGSAGAAPAASVFGPDIFVILALVCRTINAA